jgi:hypothetical protein
MIYRQEITKEDIQEAIDTHPLATLGLAIGTAVALAGCEVCSLEIRASSDFGVTCKIMTTMDKVGYINQVLRNCPFLMLISDKVTVVVREIKDEQGESIISKGDLKRR